MKEKMHALLLFPVFSFQLSGLQFDKNLLCIVYLLDSSICPRNLNVDAKYLFSNYEDDSEI